MSRGRGLKIGVIGAGSMGKNHIRLLSTLPGANLVAIAEPNEEQAKSLPEVYNPIICKDYKEAFPLVDALIIATPAQTHFDIARECLTAAKHVLIEKPFTGASGPGRNLVSLAKEKGVLLAVGMIERFNPALQRLLKEIKGEKIIGIDIKRLSPFPERIADADVIFDMMLHDLDLLTLILPPEIESIRAKGEKIRTKLFDRVVATLTYKTGVICRIEASRIFCEKTRKIAVTAEKYFIEADLLNKTLYIRDFSTPTPSTLPVKKTDQLTEELKNFVLSIKGKTSPVTSGEDAVKSLILAEEVTKACL
jgi:predicted dehydrogenase